MSPKRIQRQRTKGWRMPEGAVYVGRPTDWGNDLRAGECPECWYGEHEGEHGVATAADAVEAYRVVWEALAETERHVTNPVDLFAGIRGRDLACWCDLSSPCHADVLLELANR